jgi:hypothetical protein
MLIAVFLNVTVGWSEKMGVQEEMSPTQAQEYKKAPTR